VKSYVKTRHKFVYFAEIISNQRYFIAYYLMAYRKRAPNFTS